MKVVTVLPNSWSTLRFFLACLFSGVVPLPLSPRMPWDLVIKIAQIAQVQCVVSSIPPETGNIPCAVMNEKGDVVYSPLFSPDNAPIPKLESPVVALFATSGTTGIPKIVMLIHRNFISDIDSCFELVDISPEDVMLGVLPMFHVFGFSIAYLLPLLKGMTLTIVPSLYPFDNFITTLKRYRSTVFLGVPAVFSILTGARTKAELDLHPLRLLICGGDALPSRVRESFEEAFGFLIIEGYGITEASPVVSVSPSPEVRVPGSAGPVIDAIRLRIVDDAGKDVPQGRVGEIVLSGNLFPLDTLPIPKKMPGPSGKDGSIPGTWGRMNERNLLYIEGRKKDLIIVSGFNVYPQEVENVLMSFPGVAQVAVIGVKRALQGEIVKAYIVPQEGISLDPKEIIRFCKKEFLSYKVPRILEIVPELPQTVTGKVMKHLLSSHGKEIEIE